ncbi:orotidine-5'-phosphate decarboxylase [Cytobacillus sp. S13-E01]|uniref:orotidine-5'-phosphate decarboxylase n=1 Tax=Cytobacillus sp. S13-E01 TaxID=3031326 RepID=UPI0023D7B875|nr:orotidine-5'-phosphate decarboxylase [Cytobacillus sp. S13-E01]MDF0725247.1 orotidine-5'-phosphate decarboxylase [Cytobacillus sp. S13-E01]
MQRPLIIALDFPSSIEVKEFLRHFDQQQLFVKVGMELFYQEGPSIITYLKEQGHSIFLDLKLHDIPNTVRSAMKGLAKLGVDIINVHAAGGTAMMQAAVEGLEEGTPAGKKRPLCIAVTQLTSTSEKVMKEEIWIEKKLADTVLHYASLAKKSGLDGVVCSSLEVPTIVEILGKDFITVTPGIRLATDAIGDQERVVSPETARNLGSTAIVVGRSITKANQPIQVYRQFISDWEGVTI